MKLYKSSFIALALTASVTACTDYLEQEPPSSLTPENFYTSEDQVQAVANRFYQDIMPGHGGWDYGTYTNDNNTDVQAARTPSAKFSANLWHTGCKSKGQNPELWPAGPALLLALWRPAGP